MEGSVIKYKTAKRANYQVQHTAQANH